MTKSARTWDVGRPIYRQLMDEIIARILNQTYREGELLPSVRQLASESLVNPLTAARAYRELNDLTETRRGIGLVVKQGVRDVLLTRERQKFLQEEWPTLRSRIESLNLDVETLLRS
jgi:GntR family transcriptional regulator